MATQLAIPPPRDNARISQLLPTVKCSDCADAVLLSELAEHVCQPKPSSSLLSKRIEAEANNARAVSPAGHQKRPSSSLRLHRRASPAPTIPLPATPAGNRLSQRSTPSPTPSRATSLTHSLSIQSPTSPSPPPSPIISRPAPSVYQINPVTPILNKPSLSIHVPSNPSPHVPNPAQQSPIQPIYNVPEPDSRVGGEAGMAGVGRRGFAAAARAAMFTAGPFGQYPHTQHQLPNHPHIQFQTPPPNNLLPLKATLPHFLDISAATLQKHSDTPPSDGDNSPSPSPSPLPKSPSPQGPLGPVHARTDSSLSSESGRIKPHAQDPDTDIGVKPKRNIPPALNLANLDSVESPAVSSPAVSARLPFFEKFKNKLSTPTTSNFPDSSPIELKKGTPLANVTTRSRQSSTSSSYSFKSGAPGNDDRPTRQRQMSSASTSSSYTSASFSLAIGNEELSVADENDCAPSSPTASDSECGGLAYADETDDENNASDVSPPMDIKPIASTSRVRFPSMSSESSSESRSRAGSNASSTSGLGYGVAGLRINKRTSDINQLPADLSPKPEVATSSVRKRSNSATSSSSKSSSSSSYSRTTGVGIGMLADKARKEMETVWEDRPLSQIRETSEDNGYLTRPMAHRANTVAALPSSPNAKTVKLPTRATSERDSMRARATSDTVVETKGNRKKRVKVCVRCDKRIEDGRWVNVDSEGKGQSGGGVLCERCWKNMYLPKCRRCNLPIETQAVSSSDGQLKGKYHRDCFNCNQCHKPFPDKSFYVFDGKPLCAYHYHEANDSLCAAAMCGQPIEGPCAVSHAGDRYHPEHLTCEWPEELGGCPERLMEYWELDGRMLCEKHSQGPANAYGTNTDSGSKNAEKSRKRVTRFIDLAGTSGGNLVGDKF